MFKQITAILLLLAFIGQSFSRAVIVLDFYANRDYIAKNLCENRNKPKMNCCGKCQLNKRLKQEDKKDQQNPDRKADLRYEIALRASFAELPVKIPVQTKLHRFASYSAACPDGVAASFFHPPCA